MFLTPLAALAALAVVLPLAAYAIGRRRERTVRRSLRLGEPPRDRLTPVLLAAVPLLLALAAAQPALSRDTTDRTRSDAGVLVVFDVTRSMLASSSTSGPSRLRRAKAAALELRSAVPGVPFGVATVTDRVVPLLFPTADPAVFDSTVRRAVRVQGPPPLELAQNATNLGALGAVGTDSFFAPSTKHRVVVLLTDGESQAFDASDLAGLAGTPVEVVRIRRGGERIYTLGRAEPGYRPDPGSAAAADEVAGATHGHVFDAAEVQKTGDAVRKALGTGPTTGAIVATHRTPLGAWVALAALVPLGLVFRRRLLVAI